MKKKRKIYAVVIDKGANSAHHPEHERVRCNMIIRDFKGRLYKVLDIGVASTLLEVLTDGSRVRIRSWGWDELGFIRP